MEEKTPPKRKFVRIRKNAAKIPERPKHRAFEPIVEKDKIEDEIPDYLSPIRKSGYRKEPKKKMIATKLPLQLLTKRLGNALILYPIIKKFLKDFEAPANVIVTFFNIKYLKKPTLRDIMRTENLTSKTAWRITVKLMDLGLVEKFSIRDTASKKQIITYQISLKGKRYMDNLEAQVANSVRGLDVEKLKNWKKADED